MKWSDKDWEHLKEILLGVAMFGLIAFIVIYGITHSK